MHITPADALRSLPVAESLPARSSYAAGRMLESLAIMEGGSVALLYARSDYEGRLALVDVQPKRLMPEFPSLIAPAMAHSAPAQLPEAATLRASFKACLDGLPVIHLEALAPGPIEPIFASDGQLLGVLCLLIGQGSSASARTVDLIKALAPCLAWVLEYERIYESARKDALLVDLLQPLRDSTARDIDSHVIFQSISNLGLHAQSCIACAIFIRERGKARFRLRSVASIRDGQAIHIPDALAADDIPAGPGPRQMALESRSGDAYKIEPGPYHAVLVAPAMIEDRTEGLIVAIDHSPRTYTPDDLLRLEHLAQALATTIRNRELLERTGIRTSLVEMMWELIAPGDTPIDIIATRLSNLGCDITTPHVVVVAEASTPRAAEALRRRILDLDRCAPVAIDLVHDRITAIVQSRVLASVVIDGVTIGASRPVHDADDYPNAYREANEALALGGNDLHMSGLIRFEDLGGYRFVPALVESGLTRDALYQQISRLPGDLLLTLEAYLGGGGNTVQAARELAIHRNTMRQRMDKIRSLLDVDPTDPHQWLYLQLATMVTRSANGDLDPQYRVTLTEARPAYG